VPAAGDPDVYGRVPFYFGGTSLLIMVVVVMDFVAQLHAHMMSHQYEGLMKKANLRGLGRGGCADPSAAREHGVVR
jgi:preprotein translocase subunit SecY